MNAIPRDLNGIPIMWRDQPWSDNLRFIRVEARMTIAEVALHLPAEIAARPFALVNDIKIPRDKWHLVRLKKPTSKNPIIVTFPPEIQGGGGGNGGKSTLNAIIGIAVLIAAIVAAPYLAPAVLSGAGSLGLAIGASTALSISQAVLSIGGALIVSALTPTPSNTDQTQNEAGEFKAESSASLSGNILTRGGGVPRVCGTLKVFPPFGVPPLQTIVDDDMFLEAAFILAGPHKLEDIRIDSVPITDIPNVSYETREGFAGDAALTLVTKQSKTNGTAVEISEPKTDAVNTNRLLDQTTPANSLPVWHPTRFVGAQDEAWLCYRWPTGLLDQANPNTAILRPMRIRFRETTSGTWINVPEIWFSYAKNEGFNKDIRFIWGTPPALPTAPTANGPIYALGMVPMRVESVIAGAFQNPGVLAAFDGLTSTITIDPNNTNSHYMGANFSSQPRSIAACWIESPTTGGFTTLSSLITFNLRGSHTAPGSASAGTLLGSSAGVTGNVANTRVTIFSSDVTTAWEYIWVEMTLNINSGFNIATMNFFGDNDYSWLANGYFRNGSGITNRVMSSASNGDVIKVGLFADRVEVYLDPATFPKGNYDVQVKAGAPIKSSDFEPRRYAATSGGGGVSYPSVDGTLIYDFFGYQNFGGFKTTPKDLKGIYFKMARVRAVSVWNSAPIVGHDFAIIAVKIKNQQLGALSVMASGYTKDWDGSGWNTVKITNNPAPHLYDALTGIHNADPIPADLISNSDFVAWRTQCINKGYTVNAVFEGRTIQDVANVLSGCGYARLRPAEKWGIYMDRDRSAEGPSNVYSHKNMQNFHWDKAFPKLPDGLRARYTSADDDYTEQEIIVLRPGVTDTGVYEDIRYEGLITEADAQERALFDLAQMTVRPVFYNGITNFQHIHNRRGDLVALQIDVLDRFAGSSYAVEVLKSGSTITGLKLYGSIPIETGTAWGVAIRGLDGSLYIKQIVDPGTDDDYKEITFLNPFPDPGSNVIDSGCLIAAGPLGQEYKRVIVHSIVPKEDTAQMIFVDEAPQLWGAMTARAIIRQYGLDDSLALCLDAGDGASYTSGQLWLDTGGGGNNFYFGLNSM